MMISPLFTRLLILAFWALSHSAFGHSYQWTNPLTTDGWAPCGQAWPGETEGYQRLPPRFQKIARPAVWKLSQNGAGVYLRFFSDSPEIAVRYAFDGPKSMPHFPETGVSRPDLYRRNQEGEWQWCRGNFSEGLIKFEALAPLPTGRPVEYQLLLPTYVTTTSLEIGIVSGRKLTAIPRDPTPPIVIWGTSIVQGACATRAGTSWTTQAHFNLDLPVVNLGFSGNCRLEPELAREFAKIPASAFVIDPLQNNENRTSEQIRELLGQCIDHFRKAAPDTPLLLIEHAGWGNSLAQASKDAKAKELNATMRKLVTQLQQAGDTKLHLLTREEIDLNKDAFATVDGIHPNDLGMKRQSDAVCTKLREILAIPAPTPSTRAVTQDRDFYPWLQRHLAKRQEVATRRPRVIFIGDSITHFWTDDKDPKNRESWDTLFPDNDAANLGFGWDRTENTLWHLQHQILGKHSPDHFVINIGTNNLHRDTTPQILAGVDAIIRHLKLKHPKSRITLLGIFPRKGLHERIQQEVNPAYQALAQKRNIEFADPGKTLLTPNGTPDNKLLPDGLHPNAQAYQKLAKALKSALQPK